MNRNLNFLFALLIVMALVTLALVSRSCSTPRVPAFMDPLLTLEEAQARSSESGKPVFALVSADWCTYCDSLKRGALADSRVVAWLRANTEPVYVDATKSNRRDAETLALMSRLQVQGLPAMVLVKRGVQYGHLEGDVPAKDLLKWLEDSKRQMVEEGAVPATPGG